MSDSKWYRLIFFYIYCCSSFWKSIFLILFYCINLQVSLQKESQFEIMQNLFSFPALKVNSFTILSRKSSYTPLPPHSNIDDVCIDLLPLQQVDLTLQIWAWPFLVKIYFLSQWIKSSF